ncbi:MAG TPA: RDD family protein [Mycobacteriales bacterium]|jgi:uncharacterized RDD family membrane protein YckC|nr:RDD family protein [Mycobacteriales bacterium]
MASSHSSTTGTYAPFGRRLAALTIDWLLSYLVAALFAAGDPGPWIPLVFFLQYTFFSGLFAQTPGMRLTGVAVVRLEDGRPLGLPRAALRSLLLNLVIPAVIYGEDRRGLHDKAVGSVVVRATS